MISEEVIGQRPMGLEIAQSNYVGKGTLTDPENALMRAGSAETTKAWGAAPGNATKGLEALCRVARFAGVPRRTLACHAISR
jgi:hypothetical protein